MTCYVLRAALSSAQYSEYRQTAVPFPISNDDYETVMKRLEVMGMGDVLAQDYRVESLDSYCPVLRRLDRVLAREEPQDMRITDLLCLEREDLHTLNAFCQRFRQIQQDSMEGTYCAG